MSKMRRKVAAITLAGALALSGITAGSAFGFGGPNEAGNSGQFHPNSNPCASDNDNPNCPGPH
jgi:hypothetical protein